MASFVKTFMLVAVFVGLCGCMGGPAPGGPPGHHPSAFGPPGSHQPLGPAIYGGGVYQDPIFNVY